MLLVWLCEFALAGGVHVAVASADWDDERLARQLGRKIGAPVELVPATDLVQPGRTLPDAPPADQPGRLTDPDLRKLSIALEAARSAGDCEAQRLVAESIPFVDRSSVRSFRFQALVSAGVCAEAKGLDGPDWRLVAEGDTVILPFAHALALSGRDPGLLERVDRSARGRLEEAAVQARSLPTQSVALSPGQSVRVDGVEMPVGPEGRLELAWGRADLQLLRDREGVLAWGPSFQVESGSPSQPEAIAAERISALVSALPSDGATAFGTELGAYMGLVNADALYVAVPNKRRWSLWRWEPDQGRLVPHP